MNELKDQCFEGQDRRRYCDLIIAVNQRVDDQNKVIEDKFKTINDRLKTIEDILSKMLPSYQIGGWVVLGIAGSITLAASHKIIELIVRIFKL